MYSLDYALSKYTDMLNKNEYINEREFESNIEESEREEFWELVEMIKLFKEVTYYKKFKKVFEQIKEKRDKFYNYKYAVDFRSDNNTDNEDIDLINKIFEEEFQDE